MESVILNLIAGFIVLGIQLFFIDRIIKNNTYRREQKLWTPFRIIFLQGICDYHDNLMDCTEKFNKSIQSKLSEIRNRKILTQTDVLEIGQIVDNSKEDLDDYRKEFYFTLQTVAPSLQPYAGEYCDEVMYFEYVISTYIKKTKKLFDNLDINNENSKSHFLNGVWVMDSALSMLIELRLSKYKDHFIKTVWKKEGLHYHQGDFLIEEEYAKTLQMERDEIKLAQIPRNYPIKNFFESEEEFQERVKKTGHNKV